ncbi:MAG: maleylacetate reductase, partial [Actinomycetota bacterium]|nr:maleylacetate reductase [Actinomycetota bacterium]
AKAIALVLGLPIVAVPTTYAGSEMTPIWGLTESGQKTTGRDLKVLPKLVVYDPALTVSLPPEITGPSAINAFAHCVEAFHAPGANPITSLLAEEGIRALATGLPGAVASPEDLGARAETLYGAYIAGSAFAVAGSGLHHKICHVLGGAFDLPHAETHTVVLPHAMAFNEEAAPAVGERVRSALSAGSSIGSDAPRSAAESLYDLAREVGAPLSLEAVGMPRGGIASVVARIVAAVPESNPRAVDRDSIEALLTAAFEGHPPAVPAAATSR